MEVFDGEDRRAFIGDQFEENDESSEQLGFLKFGRAGAWAVVR